MTSSRYILKELKDHLSQLNLDIVLIQEMRGLHPEKEKDGYKLDPLEHLADEIWPHYVYGKNAVYSTGNHGNAILSRLPFKSWVNHDISTNPLERRSLLIGTVAHEKFDMTIACTHLDLTERGRLKQQSTIIEKLKINNVLTDRLILGGDFNDWRGKSRKTFCDLGLADIFQNQHSVSSFTFPAVFPVFSLDKMYYKNMSCLHSSVLNATHWKKLSDHLPILAEFAFD